MRGSFALGACAMALVIVACGGGGGDEPAPNAVPNAVQGTTPAPDSVASASCSTNEVVGDCNRVVCNPDGTPRTIADDSDVPMSIASTECMTFTCSGGTKASTPKAAGATCAGGLCDGAGTCAQGVGTACTKPSDCPSNFCADGVCCNEACTGECKSCSVGGAKGICSNVPYYEDDPSYVPVGGDGHAVCDLAVAGSKCDGSGECLRIGGTACNLDVECISKACSNTKCLGAKGELCLEHEGCVSGTCMKGVCN